jgi:hypothetical protein
MRDFERLGLEFDAALRQVILLANTTSQRRRAPRSGLYVAADAATSGRDPLDNGYGEWWDDHFAYIAGHTSGGAPFGTSWEELDDGGNLRSGSDADCDVLVGSGLCVAADAATSGAGERPEIEDDEIPF